MLRTVHLCSWNLQCFYLKSIVDVTPLPEYCWFSITIPMSFIHVFLISSWVTVALFTDRAPFIVAISICPFLPLLDWLEAFFYPALCRDETSECVFYKFGDLCILFGTTDRKIWIIRIRLNPDLVSLILYQSVLCCHRCEICPCVFYSNSFWCIWLCIWHKLCRLDFVYQQ